MGKTIVVTGGTKGIGYAILKRFAAEGFNLITCSRNQAELESVVLSLAEQYNVKVWHAVADLSQKGEVMEFIHFVQSLERPIDVLVNNAGVFIPGAVHLEEEGALEHMINTNLYSAYHLTRGLIHDMKTRKNGYIFNMCSTASIVPYVNGGSYCISKFALLGMSRVLREEMKPFGVKVTAVLPGATLTASWDGTDLPKERFMQPEDVAEAIWTAYSLSPYSVLEELLIRPQLGDI
jgi:short-subunit dehydrogenase